MGRLAARQCHGDTAAGATVHGAGPRQAVANPGHRQKRHGSYLPKPVAAWPVPTWAPTPGHWMHTTTDDAAWWVVPSLEHPGYFHVSKLYSLGSPGPADQVEGWDGASMFDGTKRPVRADVVESFLQQLGMAEPWNAEWRAREKVGLSRPFGEPEGRDLPMGRAA